MSFTSIKQALAAPGLNKCLLVICALIWGSSFFMMKESTEQIPTLWLLFIRFAIAFMLVLVVFGKQFFKHLDKRTISVGIVLGLLEWGAYVVQTYGLTMTTPGKNAFLTGTYCVMVPFCAWMLGMGRPKRSDLVAAVVCLSGLALVALDNGFPLNWGDMLTLVGAVFYAWQLVVVSKEGRALDIWALTVWQFLIMALFSLIGAALFEAPPALATVLEPSMVGVFLYLGVINSFVCLTIMNYSFTKVSPAEGSILTSLESPSGVFFSVLAGHEILTGRLVSGFALIFIAILISNAGPEIWAQIRGKKQAA